MYLNSVVFITDNKVIPTNLQKEALTIQKSLEFDDEGAEGKSITTQGVACTENKVIPTPQKSVENRGNISVTGKQLTRFKNSVGHRFQKEIAVRVHFVFLPWGQNLEANRQCLVIK